MLHCSKGLLYSVLHCFIVSVLHCFSAIVSVLAKESLAVHSNDPSDFPFLHWQRDPLDVRSNGPSRRNHWPYTPMTLLIFRFYTGREIPWMYAPMGLQCWCLFLIAFFFLLSIWSPANQIFFFAKFIPPNLPTDDLIDELMDFCQQKTMIELIITLYSL